MIGNRIKTTLLLSLLAGLFMGFGYLIGSWMGMIIGFTIAMGINFFSYWYSDKMVLKLYKAQEVSKSHKLYRMVEELAHRAKMPVPKVYLIDAPFPNAFATGRNPQNASVAATQSLVDMLSEEELRGVMAHELSHVKHRDILISTIAVGIASAISMIANIFQWMLIFGAGGDESDGFGGIIGMLVLIILTPIIATLIQLGISRSREFMADEGAAKLLRTPQPLIHALEKLERASLAQPMKTDAARSSTASLFIVNPFRGGAFSNLFSTHPTTKMRVERMKKLNFTR